LEFKEVLGVCAEQVTVFVEKDYTLHIPKTLLKILVYCFMPVRKEI
jgi:hypothetical protein